MRPPADGHPVGLQCPKLTFSQAKSQPEGAASNNYVLEAKWIIRPEQPSAFVLRM